MIVVNGTYNSAKIFTDQVEDGCLEQVRGLLNLEAFEGAQIRIMPDCHAGAGCVIGFTANLGEKIIPNIVGVDIGCGMLTVELGKAEIDFEKLDQVIRDYVPSGRDVHPGRLLRFEQMHKMHCYRVLKDTKKIQRSIGTLGGGNHFIEVDADEQGNKYLVIHTGSRQLGKQVAEYYQKIAVGLHTGKETMWEEEERIKAEYKAAGKRAEIHEALKELHRNFRQTPPDVPQEYCFLYGKYSEQYLHDMKICQAFAEENRKMIAKLIVENYGFQPLGDFTTVHNYIDLDSNIIRKGAVSAKKGERLLIPINMRDGALICVGKGNPDWNESAPHGAGRRCSRSEAKQMFSVEDYAQSMKAAGIFSTSVNESTLDECPMAYKNMDEILSNIGDTAEVVNFLKPVYNFKANSTTRKEKLSNKYLCDE